MEILHEPRLLGEGNPKLSITAESIHRCEVNTDRPANAGTPGISGAIVLRQESNLVS